MPPGPQGHETEIALVGMRFHVRVGVLPHERELPQPLEVDLAVRRDAGRSGVLDYRALWELTSDTIANEPLTYLESLADVLAERALNMEGVHWCRVAIRKPHVVLGGPLAYAQVTVERVRA